MSLRKLFIALLFIPLLSVGCSARAPQMSDEQLMDSVQRSTFRYFWDYAEPCSGMARERFHPDGVYPENDAHIVATGGSGFGLMSILAGVERGYITRPEAVERLERILTFLKRADRFHGAWPHWLNGETGEARSFGGSDDGGDIVETAFLTGGIICVREYFRDGDGRERLLADLADELWRGIEWDWYTQGGKDVLYWHWSPVHEWEMNFPIEGYNECLAPYIFGASSPTHPIHPEAYHTGWARAGKIVSDRSSYGIDHILSYNTGEPHTGPLFWAHYSYTGISPEGLRDRYADYWQLATNQAKIHYAYCVDNPLGFAGYGEDCWGLTASYSRNDDNSIGYFAHHPCGHDRGIITPSAALSSMPYTPEESIRAMRYFNNFPGLWGPAGFYDAFSPGDGWIADRYLAIDQGPIIVMIENYRSGLLWRLMMNAPEIGEGLAKLGFESPYMK